MKIVKRIRDLYEENNSLYERLSEDVCDQLKPKIERNGWFFTHRVKKLTSFALKLETGRVIDPAAMEDFFACTIVVSTLDNIKEAESLVLQYYDFAERKPKNDIETVKDSCDFRFDDLRLYVKRRSHISGLNDDLCGLVFEVQIKTILQYAWSIATHDLIYKTDIISWPKERVAFQVKAMLEHVEIAISEAGNMAASPLMAKDNAKTSDIRTIISLVEEFWPPEAIPEDRKRLAENILNVLRSADIGADKLAIFIEEEKIRNGIIPRDLSPYAFIVQALAHSEKIDFKKLFNRYYIKTRLLVHHDMELPDWMKVNHPRITYISN